MLLGCAGQRLRDAAWVSPASFALFVFSLLIITILPVTNGMTFAIIEWSEMLLGTSLSVSVAAATIWSMGKSSPPTRKNITLAITGLALWALFWVVAISVHHGSG